jgi:hypothetical protein
MPDIHDVMDVTMEELSPERQLQLKEAIDQFQQKCLMSFSKNRSRVPYLKFDMPRVLLPGEPDSTSAEEKQEVFHMVQRTLEDIMARHNTGFLNIFQQMMVDIFGLGVNKHFEGESSAAVNSQPVSQDTSVQPPPQSVNGQPTQHVDSQPVRPNPHQAVPNPCTYGEMASGTPGVQPDSTYRIAPGNNRLQKNMYGTGYSEFMDYSAIDALPNPGYGGAAGMPVGGTGNQDVNMDLLMQRMTDVLQNQFSLKPNNQWHVYTPPFPEWYNWVALPHRVNAPADFTKFFGQDDTSTMEHIARYLMQLGEASADEAFRIRYFPLSLTGPTFTWFTSLPAHSICSWKDLEQKFHAHYFIGSNEKKLIDLTTLRQRNN